MHRTSFSTAYTNGGRSPYQSYAHPPGRDQLDFVDYIPEDYSLLTPSQSRVLDDDNEPDRVHITYRGETWKLDFPPYSIAEEKVQVDHVRERVASRLGVDLGRIKLLYKDREMRRDEAPLKSYGCKQNSEITVVILSQIHDHDSRRHHHHHSGSESDTVAHGHRPSRQEDSGISRSGSTYRRRESEMRQTNGYLHPTHHSTNTSGSTSPRQGSPVRQNAPSPTRTAAPARVPSPTPVVRQPSPRPSTVPSPRTSSPAIIQPTDSSTPVGKIQALRYEFHTTWVPRIEDFCRSPPPDKEDRDREYMRLNELVSQRVFDRGDAVETEGPEKDEMRALRKTLYAEANEVQKHLDRFKPRTSN